MFETWLLVLSKEYILREFNNGVTKRLNSSRDEVMERWTELLNSYTIVTNLMH